MNTPVLRLTLLVMQGEKAAVRSYGSNGEGQVSMSEPQGGSFTIGPRESVERVLERHAREVRRLRAEGAQVAADSSPVEGVALEVVTAEAASLLRSIPLQRE